MDIQIGDTVTFVDKTGESLTGKVQGFGAVNNDPNIVTVECFKPSWDMEINCLVTKKHLRKVHTS